MSCAPGPGPTASRRRGQRDQRAGGRRRQNFAPRLTTGLLNRAEGIKLEAKPASEGRCQSREDRMSNKQTVSRRSFLRTGALAGGAAASGLAAPAVLAQSPQVIRMQSSWSTSDIFHEMAQQYADRVNAMSGGRLQVDLLPAGAVVGAFQIQDAVADGVLDAGHRVCRLLVRQDQGGVAVRHRAGLRRRRGAGARLDPVRRRQGPLPRAGAGPARAAGRRLLRAADADPAARLVRERAGGGRGHAGAEVPHRRPVGGREPGAWAWR